MNRLGNDHLVFVYGTLLRGESNHRILMGDADFIADGTTHRAIYAMADLGLYPAAYRVGRGAQGARVAGELFAVSIVTLGLLDALEGHPGLYRRHLVQVSASGNHWAWLYEMIEREVRRRSQKIVPGMNWRERAR